MLKASAIAFIVAFALEAAAIIIGNAFTIFVFWTQRFRLKRTCFLLINLAVADFLVGIAETILLVIEKIPNVGKEDKSQSPSATFQAFASSTSVMFLALISLERVYAVLWPLRHRVTNTRVYIYSIVTVWVVGLCMAGMWLLMIYHTKVDLTLFAIVTTQSFLFISLLVICASYLKIRSRLHSTSPELKVHNRTLTLERNLRFSRTFFIVAAVSLVFWLPSIIVYIIREFCQDCFSPPVVSFVQFLHLANSMVNPFVYTFRMPIFKDALKKCRRKRRLSRQNIKKNGHNAQIETQNIEFNTRL